VPVIPTTFDPLTHTTPHENQLKLLQLNAFEASYHDSPTPFTPDQFPIIIDTGASITISPYPTDFTSPIRPVQDVEIKGIAAGLKVLGIGDITFNFFDDSGTLHSVLLKDSLYVPQCSSRLLCPRQLALNTGCATDCFIAAADKSILICNGQPITVRYDSIANLPLLYTAPGISSYHRFCAHTAIDSAGRSSPYPILPNLTSAQKKKLQLHYRCNHVHWDRLNRWIRDGTLRCDKRLTNEPDPVCPSCQFGKAHRRSHKSDTGHITDGHTAPGMGVSSDGLEAGCPGRVMTTGGSPTNKRYKYCSFWIDHYSKFVYVTMHETKHAAELVRSKLEFETFARRYNVKIHAIRADNGVYAAKAFQDSCARNQQSLSFCAVGAHWQNGLAERFIGTVTQQARTILLHAMAKWPSCITEEFWPYALRHAVMVHNSSPHQGHGKPPFELFTGEQPPWSLNDFRVFGSPVFVLQKKLQDGDSFSKWRARCWQGTYIGHSTCHASNVPLVYNPKTTHITPQFHIVHDEGFTSIDNTSDTQRDTFFQQLYDTAKWLDPDDPQQLPFEYHFDSFWKPMQEHRTLPLAASPSKHPRLSNSPPISLPEGAHSAHSGRITGCEGVTTPIGSVHEGDTNPSPQLPFHTDCSRHGLEGEYTPGPLSDVTRHEGDTNPTSGTHTSRLPISPILTSNKKRTRTSAGKAITPQRQLQACSFSFRALATDQGTCCQVYAFSAMSYPGPDSELPKPAPNITPYPPAFTDFYDLPEIPSEPAIQAMVAIDNKQDTLTQSQMLKTPDFQEFLKVQESEIRGLERMEVFQYAQLPPKARLLSSIWSYRRKKRPNVSSSNTKPGYVSTAPSSYKDEISGRHMHQLCPGRLFDLFSYYQPL